MTYLTLRRSKSSQNTKLVVLRAKELFVPDSDWIEGIIVRSDDAEKVTAFKKQFHNATTRGASSRGVSIEQVAGFLDPPMESFIEFEQLWLIKNVDSMLERIPPSKQPGYNPEIKMTRKKRTRLKKTS